MAVFFTYALGMGVVLLVLTMALALARRGLVSRMRTVLPHVNRISGVLLAAAGIYVAYYGFFELWVDAGQNDIEILGLTISGDTIAWPADQVTALSADLQNWVNDVGPGRLGLIGGGLIVVAVAGWYLWLTYRQPEKLP
jgi:hypothetical protein